MPAPLSLVRLEEVDAHALDDVVRVTLSNGAFIKVQKEGIEIKNVPNKINRFVTWDLLLSVELVPRRGR